MKSLLRRHAHFLIPINSAIALFAYCWFTRPPARQEMVHIFELVAATTTTPVTITATGTQPITFTVSSGALPPGLSLSSSGVFSGTPTTAGTYTFAVTATNVAGSDTKTFSVPVYPCFAASVLGGTVGTSYSQSVVYTASGFTANCSGFAISSGSLPPGLSLNSGTGFITGTPTTAGTYPFTVSEGSIAKNLSITITASCSITTSSPLTGGTTGVNYSVTLAQTGCFGNWGATGLPAGLTFTALGAISGTPTTPGISSIVAKVGGATKTLSLTISPPAQPTKAVGVTLRGVTIP